MPITTKRLPLISKSYERSFRERTLRHPSTDCHVWIGSRDKNGYGLFDIREIKPGAPPLYISYRANRIAFLLHYGVDPFPQLVLHSCDNPSCVNGAHLSAGTPADNIRDCVEKGRRYTGRQDGEYNGNSKLNALQVKAIRDCYATGERSQSFIAKEFGIAQTAVSDIVRHRRWPSVA